jgi:hypothetical protein
MFNKTFNTICDKHGNLFCCLKCKQADSYDFVICEYCQKEIYEEDEKYKDEFGSYCSRLCKKSNNLEYVQCEHCKLKISRTCNNLVVSNLEYFCSNICKNNYDKYIIDNLHPQEPYQTSNNNCNNTNHIENNNYNDTNHTNHTNHTDQDDIELPETYSNVIITECKICNKKFHYSSGGNFEENLCSNCEYCNMCDQNVANNHFNYDYLVCVWCFDDYNANKECLHCGDKFYDSENDDEILHCRKCMAEYREELWKKQNRRRRY